MADDVAVVDGASDEGPGAGADDGAQHLFRSAWSDDLAEHAAGHTAHDQAGRAVIALAVIPIVRAAVDPIVSGEPARSIARVGAVIARGVPVAVAAVPAILEAMQPIFTAIPAVLAPIAPVLGPIAAVFAPIPAVFVAILGIAPLIDRGQRRHRLKADE